MTGTQVCEVRVPADFVAHLPKSVRRNPHLNNPGRPYLQAWCVTCDWVSLATVNRASVLEEIRIHQGIRS